MRRDLTAAATGMHIKLGPIDGPPYLTLAEVAPVVRREVDVNPEATYTELGVRSFHKGTFHRRQLTGAEFTWQSLYRVDKGDLVFSNIMAWEGAVAMAGAEDHGCVGNHRMLTCVCDVTRVNPAFLARYFETPEGMAQLVAASTGTVARNRTLTTKSLERIQVPVPPLDLQHRVVAHFDALTAKTEQVEAHLDAAERDAEHLLAVRFREAVADAPMRPMSDVAPAVRRPVALDVTTSYREVGARSFGKGLFAKPSFEGSEATWEKPVWVKAGDLVLSNIKAWEGAIAVAGDGHDGCIASHRYITCVPDPARVTVGFLAFYLLSEDGLEKVGAASPGTADRNRTLSLGNLGKIEVPVVPLATQHTFERLKATVEALKAEHAAIRAANAALLPATLERIFRG